MTAFAEAVRTLHTSLPAEVLAEVPARPGGPVQLTARVRAWAAGGALRCDGEVAAAVELGLRRLDGAEGATAGPSDVEVFGTGDGNLANYLWDGSRVRIVDFEESGRSDRVFELAEITEHVGAWVERPFDVAGFLGRFELLEAERTRLTECRCLLALVWLFLLASDEAGDHPRNPPGTALRQARRLRALLS
jgi:hypothetical protein